jgi:hypothetical protein
MAAPLTLTDPVSGTTLELYNAQSSSNDRQGSVDVSPYTGFDSDQAFLSSLEQQGSFTIQGAVTGRRLSQLAGYSSDPQTALAEWAVTFEAFVNGAPGNGYTLTRGYRTGTDFTGIVETARWSRRGGESVELGYSLEFVRGQAAGVSEPVSPDSLGTATTWTVDGVSFAGIDEVSVEKSMPVDVYRRTFAEDPDDNDLLNRAGATRRVSLTGQLVGDAASRNSTEDSLTSSIGNDEIVTVEDGFTGRTYDGMIESVENTDEAGRTRIGDVGVEFVEGTTQDPEAGI